LPAPLPCTTVTVGGGGANDRITDVDGTKRLLDVVS